MNRRLVTLSAFVCALAFVARVVVAQPIATDAERTYRDLRFAKDTRTRLLGERWYNLVKKQEWTDATGKFTTTAKYVEHDPNLEWVKLRVVKGTGADQVVRDIQIPVAKLSKTCQSRVRQISVLTQKVATAAAELKETKEADAARLEGGPSPDEALEEMRREDAAAADDTQPDRSRRRERGARRQPNDGPPVAADPLPPRSMPLPAPVAAAGDPNAAPQESETTTADRPPRDRDRAFMPDNAAWRTDYDAFRANFAANGSQDLSQVNWGKLAALKDACETVTKGESAGFVGDEALQEIAAKFAAVGEVEWEATLTDADSSAGDWTDRVGLPPLAEPLAIVFVLDEDKPTGNWQHLKTSDRVRFIGRFIDFESGGDIVVAIRFPHSVAGTPPARGDKR